MVEQFGDIRFHPIVENNMQEKIILLKNRLTANKIEAGCDEAGRGCLAGPVFAAVVILPNDFYFPLLNDSKQVKKKDREIVRKYIENHAIAYAVASVDNKEIDKLNILQASILAMHKSLDLLSLKPEFIIVDGNRFKAYKNIPHQCVVKGDATYTAVAAASILAKTYRDEYMLKLSKEYPDYGWNKNMGYPTKVHRAAIAEYGMTPYHRKSFNCIDLQLKIDFTAIE